MRDREELDRVMQLLEAMPDDAEQLAAKLSDDDVLVREAAMIRLCQLDHVDEKVFLEALHNKSRAVRFRAALQLGERKVQSARVPLIRQLEAEPVGDVRAMCAGALSRIGGIAALDALESALEDPDEHVRLSACVAFRRRKSHRAVPRLRTMLTDPSFAVRKCVVQTLVSLGITDDRLVVIAAQLLHDPAHIRNEASKQESIEEIQAALDDTHELRRYAESVGMPLKETRAHLKDALRILKKEDDMSTSSLQRLVSRARQLGGEPHD